MKEADKKKLTNQDMQRIMATPYNDLSGFERGVKLDYMFQLLQNVQQTMQQNRKIVQDARATSRNEIRLLRKLLAQHANINVEDAQWNTMLQDLIDEDKGLRVAKEGEIIEKGDWTVVRYKGFNDTDGAEVPGTTGQNELYVGARQFIEPFENAIMGAKCGDTIEKAVCIFPQDYPVKDMAGKCVMFDITIVAHKKPLHRPPTQHTDTRMVGISEGGC
jgi:FKBP-type peptidyl-prolyl cis-trans isomerase (trigger factor)